MRINVQNAGDAWAILFLTIILISKTQNLGWVAVKTPRYHQKTIEDKLTPPHIPTSTMPRSVSASLSTFCRTVARLRQGKSCPLATLASLRSQDLSLTSPARSRKGVVSEASLSPTGASSLGRAMVELCRNAFNGNDAGTCN